MRIGIVGLGIGGSIAATALAAKGMDVRVYEQARAITEVGAGVSLGPNAVRVLRTLGFGPLLERVGCEIGSVRINNAAGSLIEGIPGIVGSDGVPGRQCHRADLLNGIVATIPPGLIHLDHCCEAVEEVGDGIQLRFTNGDTAGCDVLIGADGVRSPIQRQYFGGDTLVFSGLAAYRGLIDARDLPGGRLDAVGAQFDRSTFWTDGRCYFLAYPVSGGNQLNFVGVVPATRLPEASWYGEAPLSDLHEEFAGWDENVHRIIGSVQHTFRWGMYYRRPLPTLVGRRMALLGDAAHPMVIHAGQGAGQAIEDGFALAELLADATLGTVSERLQMYDRLRLPRSAAVQRQSLANAQFMTRDVVIDEADREEPTSALGGRSWLYDFDIGREVQALRASARV